MSRLLLSTMRYKSKISRLNLDSEAAKEELDEEARPTRKLESPVVPTTDSTTTLTHRRIKGTRKIR
jgi:hypothetical protein